MQGSSNDARRAARRPFEAGRCAGAICGRGITVVGRTALSLLFAGGGSVQAATFCVTDSGQLQAALDAAESNGQDDEIRVARGAYDSPAGGFAYDSVAAPGGDDRALAVIGGWNLSGGDPCGAQQLQDPWFTRIEGHELQPGLLLRGREGSRFTVMLLNFASGIGHPGASLSRGGGLLIEGEPALSASVRVERNLFLGNRADRGGGLYLKADGDPGPLGRVAVVNNVFLANHCSTGAAGLGAAAMLYVGPSYDALYFSNNTVIANTVETGCLGGGLLVSGDARYYVVNNILWGNGHSDLYADFGATSSNYTLRNNNIEVRLGAEPDVEAGNITDVEPAFEPGPAVNFRPVRNSPLVDAGIAPTPITQWPGFYLAERDFDGNARVVGSQVDIGALENDRIFGNGFDQPFAGVPRVATADCRRSFMDRIPVDRFDEPVVPWSC